jgi:LCCL domain.
MADAGWGVNAASHRGQDDERFRYSCGRGGPLGNVWGTDIYTDDSSVCTAAVHAGLIDMDGGGTVVIEIRPGRRSYEGSSQNGVRSQHYGDWQGSFVFVGGAERNGGRSGEGERDRERSRDSRRRPERVNWSTKAADLRGQDGRRFTFDCPRDGQPNNVWGSELYTDDSSICTAAVHRGLIGFDGGTVTIEIRPGRSSYRGSRRNGVRSLDYRSWLGSFTFVE